MILPTHELVILTKFHKNWPKPLKFLVIDQFCASSDFFALVSSLLFFLYSTVLLMKKDPLRAALMANRELVMRTKTWVAAEIGKVKF